MQRKKLSLIIGGTIAMLGIQGTSPWAAEVLPKEPPPFKGVVDVSRDK